MTEETVSDRLRGNVTNLTSILVTALWLGLLFVGPGNLWLAVMLVGYIAVVPIVSMLAGDEEEETDWERGPTTQPRDKETESDPLEKLRRRYAEGKLTDEQFERKVERLLETETLEDVEDHFEGVRTGHDGEPDLER